MQVNSYVYVAALKTIAFGAARAMETSGIGRCHAEVGEV